jgi:uncharacterized protein YecE (DUF72 family)
MPVIATAAWSVPNTVASRFPQEGSGLQRYAAVFNGVEINSTFYRSHRSSTYERWAESVGEAFRFSVKVPKLITHERRLQDIAPLFDAFIDEIAPLGPKLGPLLCQLPPSLRFDSPLISAALQTMRNRFDKVIVIEPRHRSWAGEEAFQVLDEYRVGRVLADPAPVWNSSSFAEAPAYIRLHGSPEIYYSRYSPEQIAEYAALLGPQSWCVFDNTASGAAIENALEMLAIA